MGRKEKEGRGKIQRRSYTHCRQLKKTLELAVCLSIPCLNLLGHSMGWQLDGICYLKGGFGNGY